MSVSTKKGLLLAIDSNSLLHRAYHAYPLSLVTSDGKPVNAVYGFTSMLLDALLKYKPEYVFCAFDTDKPTFRHSDYVGYKANRVKADSELVDQIATVDEILNALNIPIFRLEGFEADDILGTITHKASLDIHGPVSFSYILTGDRDLFQLVNEKVQAILPKGSFKNLAEYGEQEVLGSVGVPPERVTDLKGLMGDASDNIPGVRGIGPKTAADLITMYGSLEDIYTHINEIGEKSKKIAEKLANEQETAYLSKKLATIEVNAPLNFSYEKALMSDFSLQKATSVFSRFQFKSLLPKLKKLAESVQHLEKMAEQDVMDIAHSGSLQEEFTEITKKVIGLSNKAIKQSESEFLNRVNRLANSEESVTEIEIAGSNIRKRVEILGSYLKKLETDKESQFIVMYVYKKLYSVDISSLETSFFHGARILMFGFFDYLNDATPDETQTNLSESEQEILSALMAENMFVDIPGLEYALTAGRGNYAIEDTLGHFGIAPHQTKERLLQVALLRILQEEYRVADYKPLERISELWKQWPSIKSAKSELSVPLAFHYFEDKPTLFGVALMHLRGVGVDTQRILDYGKQLEQKIADLEKAIFEDVGHEFNIRSTRQLGDVLFNHLGLPTGRKIKTGFSTDDEVLQELIPAHPAVKKVLDYRMYSKLLNTYIRPFIDLAIRHSHAENPEGKPQQLSFTDAPKLDSYFRIHSFFNPMYTPTGRLSSKDPNLQNLPIKTEEGKEIRKFFIPEQGKIFLTFDYSQIDLRVMAHISSDPGLIAAFIKDGDIHQTTAAKIFGVKYDKVDKSQRRIAKIVNFGLLYGMSSFGLSRSINVSVHEAAEFMKAYFEAFPNVEIYMKDTAEFAKKYGYVLSLLGRRKYVYGLDSNAPGRKMAAQREAINMPIQGGTDDIMRLALGKVSLLPDVLSGKLRLVLQVHDELIFETDDDEKYLEKIVPEIQDIMKNVVKLKVPLKVEWAKGYDLSI